VFAPDTLYPPPDLAAGWACTKISLRTQYLFCNLHQEGAYPEPTLADPSPYPAPRRSDLAKAFVDVVSTALHMMFVQHLEAAYLWHYKRDVFSMLENQGQSSVQFLERDELWQLFTLGIRYRAIFERCSQITSMWEKIKNRSPDVQDDYLTGTLLLSVCMLSVEAAAEGYDWLAYHYTEELRRIKEDEAIEEGTKRLPERAAQEDLRAGPIMQLVQVSDWHLYFFSPSLTGRQAYGVSVSQVAVTFNDLNGTPVPPKNPERLPMDLAAEFAGKETSFPAPEDALKGEHQSNGWHRLIQRRSIEPYPHSRIRKGPFDPTTGAGFHGSLRCRQRQPH